MLDPDALLRFFAIRGRSLPWRDAGATPWRVLTSEVMLQQTPVVRVVPVFDAWMERWSTPAALAAGPSGEPVRAWGRLGYPRRALRLWQSAGQIVERFGGEVPTTVTDLLTLPGVGHYTARAVAAFGDGRRVPVVDTNVRRVMNRVIRGTDDAGPATPVDLMLMETQLPQPPTVAARFSAAVMELGALVCTAATPSCDECPLRDQCRWRLAGSPPSEVKRRTQAWHGTDRQVRGRILAVLREADEPLTPAVLAAAWPEPAQWSRCLESLVADGLTERTADGRLTLPR
ncbi:MAG: A/G-specific adenine glycosylase [Nakamurella sp.]